jgi:hypothetical protein
MPSWHVQFYGDDGNAIGEPQPYDERSGITEIPEGATRVRHYFEVSTTQGAAMSCIAATTQVASPPQDYRRPRVRLFGFGPPPA